jgi:hypothetical protein|tara:strand:+ start:61 stop:486 length:426 start_codon:yes stop_codon:yes gene_type:complete
VKRLYFLLISLFVIGCSDSLSPENCDCNFNITSELPQNNGVYELEYDSSLAQTYSVLSCQTECGWSQHVQWDSDHMYQIQPNQWVSLVNPASMTDEFGEGKVVFAVWEEFVDKTITIYGGYTDDCGHHFVDSIKVKIVDNE